MSGSNSAAGGKALISSADQTGSWHCPGRLDKKPDAFLKCERCQILCQGKKLVLTTELVSGIRKPIDFEMWELEVFGPALYHVLKDEHDTNS